MTMEMNLTRKESIKIPSANHLEEIHRLDFNVEGCQIKIEERESNKKRYNE